jgi:NADH:ubiquinone oxidoreductase subunit 3 (subunit A)
MNKPFEGIFMFETIIAFFLVLFCSLITYVLTGRFVQKTIYNEEKSSMYACGEKVFPKRLLVNVSLYKYLIFFVILDSPVLILAFGALALEVINPFNLLIYLSIILAADMLLLGGS